MLLLVLLFTGALFDSIDDLVTVLLAAIAVATLAGWYQDKLARAEADQVEAARRRQEQSEVEEHDRVQHERYLRELKSRSRLERAHKAERQWARELREQVSRLHREQGPLGRGGDVREMVLQTAIQLTEADKGLLLSREDRDGDGDFDLVCHVGFDHDPTHSAVAQDFAQRVLRHDETVREDDSSELHGEGRNPADDEIHTLLAIPIYIQDDFSGVVVCANREGGFADLDDEVLLALGDHAGAVLENGRLHGELHSSYVATVRMLAEAIEAKDPSTRLHSEEVAEYVRRGGRVAGDRAPPARGAADRLAAARRGQDRDLRAHPAQARPADPGGARGGGAAPADRLPAGAPGAGAGGRRARDAAPPRALGRPGLPRRPGRRRDPARGARDLRGRLLQRDDRRPALPRAAGGGRGVRRAGALRGHQFDPRVVALFVEEVRAHPPGARAEGGGERLDAVLDDPEVQAIKEPGEPVVGYGPAGAVDNLTLLYSHRHLHEKAARLAQEAAMSHSPFSVILLELHSLGEINDQEGYGAGDRAIVEAAPPGPGGRACGGTACRYGGKRLAVLAPDMSEEAAAALGRDLETELEADGPPARAAVAEWRPGDPPTAAVARARLALASRELGVTRHPRLGR